MKKYALITGINGQMGFFLSEFLLKKQYKLFGIIRYTSQRRSNLNSDNLKIFYGDITDSMSLMTVFNSIKKEIGESILEIYHLAGQSSIGESFKLPYITLTSNSLGTLTILETLRILNMNKQIKFCQASSSEMFGTINTGKQNENTPFHPRSPYGVAKLCAYWITENYKESYDMYACSCILFNNYSIRTSEYFVVRKITSTIANIIKGNVDCIHLGNINVKRDIGHTKDYCNAMYLMLQQDVPNNYVVSTGKATSIRELVEKAFKIVDIDIEWEGEGLKEIGRDKGTKKVYVRISEEFFRPCEIQTTVGDNSLAKKNLDWEPEINIDMLIKELIDHDLKK